MIDMRLFAKVFGIWCLVTKQTNEISTGSGCFIRHARGGEHSAAPAPCLLDSCLRRNDGRYLTKHPDR